MTQITETASIDTAIEPRFFRSVWVGTLSNVEPREMGGEEILIGTLSRVVKGEQIDTTVSVSGEAMASVAPLFVEGPIALYGEIRDGYFRAIGPDLRKRTLARAEARAVAPVKPVRTPEQKLAARRAFFAARATKLKAAAAV